MRWSRYCRSGLWRPKGWRLNSRASSSRVGSMSIGSAIAGVPIGVRLVRERRDAARELALQQRRIDAVGDHAEALREIGAAPRLVRGHEAWRAAVALARGDDLVDRREIGG